MILLDKAGHLVSDTSLEELHEFAKKIGMRRYWFQEGKGKHPHYDIWGVVFAKALEAGATLVDSEDIIRGVRKMNTKRPDYCVSCKTRPVVHKHSGGYDIHCECGLGPSVCGTGPFIELRKEMISFWNQVNKEREMLLINKKE